MKLRFQFGVVLAAFLAAILTCSPASGEKFKKVGQAEAPPRRGQRQPKNGSNAMRPGVNPGNRPGAGNMDNLPPKAFERLQDMPPDKQERFLQNNQRFRNLPPDQQALCKAAYGEGLRQSMAATALIFIPAAGFFLASSMTYKKDLVARPL